MNLFDNLSDKLEWSKVDFSFNNEQDSDLGPDEVAPNDFDASPPPFTTISSLYGAL